MTWTSLNPQAQLLGESPFWHPRENRLYWVDIPGRQLLRARGDGLQLDQWDMPSEPGCIAPAASGGLVIALRNGVFRARTWGGALTPICTLPYDTATVRANDGKCDALGRFWVGTIDEPKASRAAALFSIDCRFGKAMVQRQAGDALTGNGLAWSLDAKTVWWSDTPNHVVHAWDYDLQANTLTHHREHIRCAPKPTGWTFEDATYAGRPDGAAVDVQGNYYAAMYEGARICKFAPDGRVLEELPVPAQCPTMPCFGGADLKTLYVTSASQGRSSQETQRYPQAGCVFYRRVDVPGLPVNFFMD